MFINENGFASASSEYGGYPASNGFKDGGRPWRSSWNPTIPQLIWFEFNKSYRPAKITFKRRQDGHGKAKHTTPIKFEFVGGSATGSEKCAVSSHWITICDTAYSEDGSLNEPRECHVDEAQAKSKSQFRCLGVKVLEVSGEKKGAALQDIRIWIWQ